MILSFDYNPVLKKIIHTENQMLSEGIFNSKEIINIATGDGCNCSKMLAKMGENVRSTGFLGGHNGSFIEQLMSSYGVVNDYVYTKGETLERIKAVFSDKVLELQGNKPIINREESFELISKFGSILPLSDIICAFGDSPQTINENLPFEMIKKAQEYNIKALVAFKGNSLSRAIKAAPYLTAINKGDLEELTNLELDKEQDIILACNAILSFEVKHVVVFDEQKCFYVSDKLARVLSFKNSTLYRIHCDIGFFVAGYALGLSRGYDEEMTLKLAYACSSYDADTFDRGFDMASLKANMNKIEDIIIDKELR